MSWETVGVIDVDAGCVMVGDPCYTQGDDALSHVGSWHEFLEKTWPAVFGPDAEPDVQIGDAVYALGEEGLGVVVSSGYGDGRFPVLVQRENGRVKAVKVVFFGDGE